MKLKRIPAKLSEWKVKSSDGDKKYIITSDGKGWYCSCPAGMFLGYCKHIEKIREIHQG